jgi:cell division protein FtsX
MIDAPLDACRARRLETAGVALAIVVLLAFPTALALTALCTESAASQWLAEYRPVIYLTADAQPADAEALAQEIETWPLASQAAVRTPSQARGELATRLGHEVVDDLGITQQMLPHSVLVTPKYPVVGHVDLVSRVTGLKARPTVDAVEVPSSDAVGLLTACAVGLGVATLLALFGMLAAFGLLVGFLHRLRASERDLERVLALLGTGQSKLRRPTVIRGVTVGVSSGLLVSASAAAALLAWQLFGLAAVGASVVTPTVAWLVACAPMFIIAALGLFAGIVASSRRVPVHGGAHA